MNVLITAGPTREPIDSVRFVSNRSSGRMGVALVDAAADAGHRVTLLLGPVPVHAQLAERCDLLRFETCAQLQALLEDRFPAADLLIMAAAVADYRPAQQPPEDAKIPRAGSWSLRLEPTPDLVARVAAGRRPDQKVIAFALEQPDRLEQRAAAKMQRKGVDAIVANPLDAMDGERICAIWLTAAGGRAEPGPMNKVEFAGWLIGRAERLCAGDEEAAG